MGLKNYLDKHIPEGWVYKYKVSFIFDPIKPAPTPEQTAQRKQEIIDSYNKNILTYSKYEKMKKEVLAIDFSDKNKGGLCLLVA